MDEKKNAPKRRSHGIRAKIRERMAAKGESYAVAHAAIVAAKRTRTTQPDNAGNDGTRQAAAPTAARSVSVPASLTEAAKAIDATRATLIASGAIRAAAHYRVSDAIRAAAHHRPMAALMAAMQQRPLAHVAAATRPLSNLMATLHASPMARAVDASRPIMNVVAMLQASPMARVIDATRPLASTLAVAARLSPRSGSGDR